MFSSGVVTGVACVKLDQQTLICILKGLNSFGFDASIELSSLSPPIPVSWRWCGQRIASASGCYQWRRHELKFGGCSPSPPFPSLPVPSHVLVCPSHSLRYLPLPSSIPSFMSPSLFFPSLPIPLPSIFPSPSLPRNGP